MESDTLYLRKMRASVLNFMILVVCLGMTQGLSAQSVQYAWNYHENAGNPGGLLEQADNLVGVINTTPDVVLQGPINVNQWSDVIQLPFPFVFYGDTTQFLRASTNGLITLDTLDTALLNGNTALPQGGIPDRCIGAFWTNFANFPPVSASAQITYFTVGTAPHRQCWIKWNDFELGPGFGIDPIYMAVVLEETTNTIYMVDMYSANSPVLGGYNGTVGIQDFPNALQAGEEIDLMGNTIYPGDNDYYEFFLLDSLNAQIEAFTTLEEPICGGIYPLTIEVRNTGITVIDSMIIAYGWNGASTNDTIGGLSIGPNETDTLTLDSLFFLAGNTYDFEFAVVSVNGTVDNDQTDDTLTIPGAQTGLIGNYTINPNLITSGNNYQTLDEAAHALNNWGICGAVQFSLSADQHNGNLYLMDIKGSSNTDTIGFMGDAADTSLLTHDGIGKRFNVRLYGTKHASFHNLHLLRPGTGLNESSFRMDNGCDSIAIDQCTFRTGTYSPSPIVQNGALQHHIWISRDTIPTYWSNDPICDNLSVTNCYFEGDRYGIRIVGESNGAKISHVEIDGNTFIDHTQRAIDLRYVRSVQIADNYIENKKLNGGGIELRNTRFFDIQRNEVYTAQNALRLANDNTVNVQPIQQVQNNILSARNEEGFYIDDIRNVRVMNNTCDGKVGAALHGDLDQVSFLNNIFHGRNQALYRDNFIFTVDTLDYNLYYSDSTTLIRNNNAYYNDLPSYQAVIPGYDSNSIEGQPFFKRQNNLRRYDTVANNASSTIISLNQDIDGNPRSSAGFDIGAHEFEPVSTELDFITLLSPRGVLCEDSAQIVEVMVRNNGTVDIDTIPYTIVFQGSPSNSSYSDTLITSIGPFSTDTLSLGPFSTVPIDTGSLLVFHTLPFDADGSNDTVASSIAISHAVPNNPVLLGDTVCSPDSIASFMAIIQNGIGAWYESLTSDSILAVGNSYEETLSTTIDRFVSFTNDPKYEIGHVPLTGDSMATLNSSSNLFNVFENSTRFTLDSVTVYPSDTGWIKIAQMAFDFFGPSYDTHQVVYQFVEPDSAFAPVQIPVGITFEPGKHGLATFNDLSGSRALLRTAFTVNYPYEIPNVLRIEGALTNTSFYYWFYDWKISVNGCSDTNRYAVTALFEDSDLSLPDDAFICQDDSLVITPTTTGGTFNSLLWMDGSTNPTYTATGPSVVSVIGETILGCIHEDNMVVDTFSTTPTLVPNDTTICDSDQVILPTLGGSFITNWTFNGNNVSNASLPGTYVQDVLDQNGCTAIDTFQLDTIDCDTSTVGLNSTTFAQDISVYPNPAQTLLNVKIVGHRTEFQTALINGLGQVVWSGTSAQQNTSRIPVSGLSRGFYLLEVRSDQHVWRKQVILN